MFWLKACPKCQGDLYQGEDAYGAFIACMQCSRYLSPPEEAALHLAAVRPDLQQVAARQTARPAA